jgi:hypothetical protein
MTEVLDLIGEELQRAAERRLQRPRARWWDGLASRVSRLRVFILVGAAVLVAGGTAAALDQLLAAQPSAPPSGTLTSPAADSKAAAKAYAVSVTPNLQAGGVGWCVATHIYYAHFGGASGGLGCGYAPLPDRPIIATAGDEAGSRSGNVYTSTPQYVFVTTAQVAAVRIARSLTIRTRRDPQLPSQYRVAIYVHETISHKPIPSSPPLGAAVALDRTGRQIGLPASDTGEPRDPAVFWPSASAKTAPAGACEIDTRGLQASYGLVVKHVRGFPFLTDKTFLACATTSLRDGKPRGVLAAVLLDAQHPGLNAPPPLPNAAPVPGHPGTFNEGPVAPRSAELSITGRRIGNAWLVVQASGSLQRRLAMLDRIGACVHLTPGACPAP